MPHHDHLDEITYFSIFTGVGGFELGLQGVPDSQSSSGMQKQSSGQPGRHDAPRSPRRFRCVGVAEIDKFACRVLRKRFPTVRNYGDIRGIDPQDLPDFDLLCGGFPCQAFSVAGKRKGFEDTRGSLFFEIARLVQSKRPSVVLLENVKGLLHHDRGATYRVVLQTLAQLGYDVQWMVLNSKFFGVPQNRERVFLVGSLRTRSRPQVLPFRTSPEAAAELRWDQTNTLKTDRGPPSYIAECQQLPETRGRSQGERIYRTDGVSQTLLGNGGASGGKTGLYQENRDSTKVRRLTPRECERLQGFPDDWTKVGLDDKGNEVPISDSQRYKQMGNAVTVNVIRAIAERLAESWESGRSVDSS